MVSSPERPRRGSVMDTVHAAQHYISSVGRRVHRLRVSVPFVNTRLWHSGFGSITRLSPNVSTKKRQTVLPKRSVSQKRSINQHQKQGTEATCGGSTAIRALSICWGGRPPAPLQRPSRRKHGTNGTFRERFYSVSSRSRQGSKSRGKTRAHKRCSCRVPPGPRERPHG